MKTSKDSDRKHVEKNVWVEVTKRKDKGKEIAHPSVDPSPMCKVPPLKEVGSASRLVRPASTATSERKILLDKIHDLQRVREKSMDGSNLTLRRSSRSRLPPMSLSGGDFIVININNGNEYPRKFVFW